MGPCFNYLRRGGMLAHLFEAKGVKHAKVARASSIAVSTLSEVLAGNRQLSRGHTGRLAAFYVGPQDRGAPCWFKNIKLKKL